MAKYYAQPVEAEQYLPKQNQIPSGAREMSSKSNKRAYHSVIVDGDIVILEDGDWVVTDSNGVCSILTNKQFAATYSVPEVKATVPLPSDIVWWVEYTERERGWGGEIWYRAFETEAEAHAANDECNARNTAPSAPDYYIQSCVVGPQRRDYAKYLKEYKL